MTSNMSRSFKTTLITQMIEAIQRPAQNKQAVCGNNRYVVWVKNILYREG